MSKFHCKNTDDDSDLHKIRDLLEIKIVEEKDKLKYQTSVCLTHCRYDIVKRIVNELGYKLVSYADSWNFYWSDYLINSVRCKNIQRFQKINHFPGILEICRKNLLANNLNRMNRLFPHDYDFFPKTWLLPEQLPAALAYSKMKKNKTFIIKPEAGCQGRGIVVTKSLTEFKTMKRSAQRLICQVYIQKPFLLDGYKFDIRVYVFITSCDPLRVYVYEDGLIRLATTKYEEPNDFNLKNSFMHLTNYAVNKNSHAYMNNHEYGSKRKLSWLNNHLYKTGHDVHALWRRIDDVIIKTLISIQPKLKNNYRVCFPNHEIPACCQLLGFDIILNQNLIPYILEVNHSPSFHTNTELDWEIKLPLVTNIFKMINLELCDKKKVIQEEKQRVKERLLYGRDEQIIISRNYENHFKHEMQNRGKFRLVFPNKHSEIDYDRFFIQLKHTFSRSNFHKKEILRRHISEKSLKSVSETNFLSSTGKKGKALKDLFLKAARMKSSEPQKISEMEERIRLQKLAEREFLVRSQGIFEYIYFSMKENGNLKPSDKKKFAVFEEIYNDCKNKTKISRS